MSVTRTTRSSVPTPELVVRLSGEVDLGTVTTVMTPLDGVATATDGDVVIDLSQVTFMACAGLRPLLGVQRELGNRLWLRAPTRPVLRLLQVTGLLPEFQIVPAAGTEASAPEAPRLVDRRGRTSEVSTTMEQARGIVMGVHDCDAAQAQQLLEQAAAQGGLSLGGVAAALTSPSALVADRTQGAGLSEVLRSLPPAARDEAGSTSRHRPGDRVRSI